MDPRTTIDLAAERRRTLEAAAANRGLARVPRWRVAAARLLVEAAGRLARPAPVAPGITGLGAWQRSLRSGTAERWW